MHRFAIGDLEIISQTLTTRYLIESVDGLDDPDRAVGSYTLPGMDGGYVGSAWYGLRGLTITGAIKAKDVTEYQLGRTALVRACRLERDAYGLPVAKPIALTTFDGASYQLSGVVKSCKIAPINRSVASFIISVVCPDPLIYGLSPATTGAISRPSGGGVTFPLSFPSSGIILFGSATGGTGTVSNTGEADTLPTVTLSGPLTNPSVYHVESGTTFQLNYVLGASDVAVVDMAARTVVLNGSASLIAAKTTDSNWFALQPGTNTIRFNSGSSSDTGTSLVKALPAYLAVA